MLQHEKLQSAPGSRVGTPAYLAPEVVLTTKGKTYDGKVLHQLSNVPSDGLLLYKCFTKRPATRVSVCSKVCKWKYLLKAQQACGNFLWCADCRCLVMWSHAVHHAVSCLSLWSS